MSAVPAPAAASPPRYPASELVTVMRRATGAARTYAAGEGQPWPYAFERDLHEGVFGAQSREKRGSSGA